MNGVLAPSTPAGPAVRVGLTWREEQYERFPSLYLGRFRLGIVEAFEGPCWLSRFRDPAGKSWSLEWVWLGPYDTADEARAALLAAVTEALGR